MVAYRSRKAISAVILALVGIAGFMVLTPLPTISLTDASEATIKESIGRTVDVTGIWVITKEADAIRSQALFAYVHLRDQEPPSPEAKVKVTGLLRDYVKYNPWQNVKYSIVAARWEAAEKE